MKPLARLVYFSKSMLLPSACSFAHPAREEHRQWANSSTRAVLIYGQSGAALLLCGNGSFCLKEASPEILVPRQEPRRIASTGDCRPELVTANAVRDAADGSASATT